MTCAKNIIIASPDVTCPDCPNLALLVKFKSTPNGRSKSIIITNNEIIHVEPDDGAMPYSIIKLSQKYSAWNKHNTVTSTSKAQAGLKR